jgi:hypothetical protein
MIYIFSTKYLGAQEYCRNELSMNSMDRKKVRIITPNSINREQELAIRPKDQVILLDGALGTPTRHRHFKLEVETLIKAARARGALKP